MDLWETQDRMRNGRADEGDDYDTRKTNSNNGAAGLESRSESQAAISSRWEGAESLLPLASIVANFERRERKEPLPQLISSTRTETHHACAVGHG